MTLQNKAKIAGYTEEWRKLQLLAMIETNSSKK